MKYKFVEANKITANRALWSFFHREIKAAPLFSGLNEQEVLQSLSGMEAVWRQFEKDQLLITAGDKVERIGLLLQGTVEISRPDIMGNQFILTQLTAPSLFAEVLACAELDTSPVTIKAMTDTVIMMLDLNKILTNCDVKCPGSEKLVNNLLRLLARKNLMLNEKLDIISKRSLRGKISAMLLAAAAATGNAEFRLPYNRQEMADFLAVDRSALSRELSKMQSEGLIRYQRNNFQIIDFSTMSGSV